MTTITDTDLDLKKHTRIVPPAPPQILNGDPPKPKLKITHCTACNELIGQPHKPICPLNPDAPGVAKK